MDRIIYLLSLFISVAFNRKNVYRIKVDFITEDTKLYI